MPSLPSKIRGRTRLGKKIPILSRFGPAGFPEGQKIAAATPQMVLERTLLRCPTPNVRRMACELPCVTRACVYGCSLDLGQSSWFVIGRKWETKSSYVVNGSLDHSIHCASCLGISGFAGNVGWSTRSVRHDCVARSKRNVHFCMSVARGAGLFFNILSDVSRPGFCKQRKHTMPAQSGIKRCVWRVAKHPVHANKNGKTQDTAQNDFRSLS